MYRKLFYPYPATAGHRAWPAAGRGGYPYGWNPEAERVMPPPSDPGSGNPEEGAVVPPPSDPGSGNPEEGAVMPPPSDPPAGDPRYPYPFAGGSPYPAYGPGYGVPLAAPWGHAAPGCLPASCGCRCEEDETAAASPCPGVRPEDYSGFVIVRTAVGVDAGYDDLWQLAEELGLDALKAVLELTAEKTADDGDEAGGGGGEGQDAALALGRRRRRRRRGEDRDAGGKGGNADEPADEDSSVDGGTEDDGRPAGTLVSRPLIHLWNDCGRKDVLEVIAGLEKKVATSPFKPLHSLGRYWRLDLRPWPQRVEEVVERLNALAQVDLAYRELAATDPQRAATGASFAEDQGYLDDAPVGIGARWAWEEADRAGGTPQPIDVCDLEQQWRPEHGAFGPEVVKALRYGANRDAADEEDGAGNHGNAVLGQLAATGNLRGAAQTIGRFVLASHYWSRDLAADDPRHPFRGTNGHVAAAIVNALVDRGGGDDDLHLKEGDVLLLEVQRGRLPAEVDAADFDAIRLASALGVVVVAAAGNGGVDLDACVDLADGRSLRRGSAGFRDSGAIMVGAAWSALPHDRASFSNYGSRLDCYAWGDSVTSCGYGDLAGEAYDDYYTNTFSGTSSAAPVIAGAAALLQYLHRGASGGSLGPRALRALLANPRTGTPQGPNVGGHVGVMPDLEAIVRGELQLVPDLYLRRRVGDDGETPGRDEAVSSSPDLGVGPPPPGEGAEANEPAPGKALDASLAADGPFWVRLRNRGQGKGSARVSLFASQAATLVTPERWFPVGAPVDLNVDQGDLLAREVLNASFALPPSPAPPEWDDALPPVTLLAVVHPAEPPAAGGFSPPVQPEALLPPGPPYFDWAEYRAFLRRRGVGWRNVHRVPAGDASLAFLVAGTPERTRHFDFEVIQRLPAGAQVTWTVPQGLAAKLKQSQPLLAGATAPTTTLALPQRPRTAIGRVCLGAGHAAPARFAVTGSVEAGHSLALRQLWRGEEVGRITWYFG